MNDLSTLLVVAQRMNQAGLSETDIAQELTKSLIRRYGFPPELEMEYIPLGRRVCHNTFVPEFQFNDEPAWREGH
jgi:hypothetical protein